MPVLPRRDERLEEVNLIPIMNMMVVLIPLLITQSTFLSIGLIDLTPAGGAAGRQGAEGPSKVPLDFRVFVLPAGSLEVHYNDIHAANPQAALQKKKFPAALTKRCGGEPWAENCGGEKDPQCKNLPCREMSDYDYTSLSRTAGELKKVDPSEDRVLVSIEPTTPFYVLVRVMDSTRGKFDPNRVLIDPKTQERVQGAYEWFENVNIDLRLGPWEGTP